MKLSKTVLKYLLAGVATLILVVPLDILLKSATDLPNPIIGAIVWTTGVCGVLFIYRAWAVRKDSSAKRVLKPADPAQLSSSILDYCEHGSLREIVVAKFLEDGYSEEAINWEIERLLSSGQLVPAEIKHYDTMLVTVKDYSAHS